MIFDFFRKKKIESDFNKLKREFDSLPEPYQTAILNALWRRTDDDSTAGVDNDRIKYACKQMAMFFVTGEMTTP